MVFVETVNEILKTSIITNPAFLDLGILESWVTVCGFQHDYSHLHLHELNQNSLLIIKEIGAVKSTISIFKVWNGFHVMQMQFPPLSHFSGSALLIVYHNWGINHIVLVTGYQPCNLKTFKFCLDFSALHLWNLDVWFQLTMLILRSDWLFV